MPSAADPPVRPTPPALQPHRGGALLCVHLASRSCVGVYEAPQVPEVPMCEPGCGCATFQFLPPPVCRPGCKVCAGGSCVGRLHHAGARRRGIGLL